MAPDGQVRAEDPLGAEDTFEDVALDTRTGAEDDEKREALLPTLEVEGAGVDDGALLSAGEGEGEEGEATPPTCTQRARAFLMKHLLAFSLIFAVLLGIAWPTPGVHVGKKTNGESPSQFIFVITIFLISGLKLKTSDVQTAFKAYRVTLWGIFSILFVTGLIAINLTQQITFPDVPDFRAGLVVFWAMPTTISSGVVLTQTAKGNYALALLLTAITNVVAVFTIPPTLNWLGDFGTAVSLDVVELIIKLVATVLAPLVVGKLLRLNPKVEAFVTKYSRQLKYVSIVCLAAISWTKVSKTRDDGDFDDVTGPAMLTLIAWAVFIHVVFLSLNFGAVSLLTKEIYSKKPIVLLASQKTLPVALTVIGFLPASVGSEGLMSIACIIAHLSQIVVDSFVAGYWAGFLDADDAAGTQAVGPSDVMVVLPSGKIVSSV